MAALANGCTDGIAGLDDERRFASRQKMDGGALENPYTIFKALQPEHPATL
ncbi:MAG: hypothetical protein M3069_13445 [Chloroflexota bacterium]|nr:hypothetical protein [Chloroflexota bacterium]